MPFYCTICEAESNTLCIACTKDTCANHLCAKCEKCSDCCNCELALEPHETQPAHHAPHQPSPSEPEAKPALTDES